MRCVQPGLAISVMERLPLSLNTDTDPRAEVMRTGNLGCAIGKWGDACGRCVCGWMVACLACSWKAGRRWTSAKQHNNRGRAQVGRRGHGELLKIKTSGEAQLRGLLDSPRVRPMGKASKTLRTLPVCITPRGRYPVVRTGHSPRRTGYFHNDTRTRGHGHTSERTRPSTHTLDRKSRAAHG